MMRRGNGGGLQRQKGQVMPMTAILIVAVLLSLWTMYDSGQLMTERMKLQNTADNVAYSSSALVARDLNFTAYTNRAMVANQVAMGQMVGLSSWAAMMEQLGENIGTLGKIANVIPYVGQAIYAITRTIESATEALAQAVDKVAEVIIPTNNLVNGALSNSQEAFHLGMSAALVTFSDEVAKANDPDAHQIGSEFLSPVQAFGNWSRQIGRYENAGPLEAEATNQRFDEFANVVGESRDPFTRRRSYKMDFPLSGPGWETQKRGGSDLKRSEGADGRYEWDWTAMDTVSLEVEIGKTPWSCVLCMDVPMGWGAAHALEGKKGSSSYYDYERGRGWGSAWDNGSAANLARAWHRQHKLANTGGLQPFYAFKDDEAPNTHGPALVYLFRKDASTISLTDDLGTDEDNPLHTGAGDGFISAAAKGQPHYSRPTDVSQFARQDGNFEYGNLYNPFWQPRLVKLNNMEKSALAVAAGISE